MATLLKDYAFSPSEAQCEMIRAYVSLLLYWNSRVSLTRVTGVEEIIRFHFGESLHALTVVPIENGRLADLGSGAGFPGVALKLGHPTLDLTLLETNQRKAAFLGEVKRELRFEGVEIFRTRFEQFPSESGPFDFVTSRALGSFHSLVRFAESRLAKGGKLVLWLGKDNLEVVRLTAGLRWMDPVLIPGSSGRYILVGSKK